MVTWAANWLRSCPERLQHHRSAPAAKNSLIPPSYFLLWETPCLLPLCRQFVHSATVEWVINRKAVISMAQTPLQTIDRIGPSNVEEGRASHLPCDAEFVEASALDWTVDLSYGPQLLTSALRV
jgi:hypothetical protein